ncbi:MAG: histidine kinase dimerization/phospho-acceptor domain-containing protein [Bdellovibrionales bacterium]|jgi:PAS domain-containing protein|nr:histidine kinase dimerization/phospho-acceptor domain-containing protein [Bdellovibrionales bacterium]
MKSPQTEPLHESTQELTHESNLTSSIALIGDPAHESLRQVAESLGAVILSENSLENWSANRVDVLALSTELLQGQTALLTRFCKERPTGQIIAVGNSNKASEEVLTTLRSLSLFAWVESFDSPEFHRQALQAVDQAQEARQAAESLALYHEHNESLQKLSRELESRIEDRRAELNASTERLQLNHRRNEIMHRALNAVHLSHSIPEMERLLVEVLHPKKHAASDAPGVEWVRIAFTAQSRLDAPIDARAGAVFSSALSIGAERHGQYGHIHFGRSPSRPFRSDDRSFLAPIVEAVSLAVTRLRSLERMEQIKREWEETFNAIVDPVAVLDDQLRLVRGNRALLRGRPPEKVVGRPCYEAVFERAEPCAGCPVQQNQHRLDSRDGRRYLSARQFRVESGNEQTCDVHSRPLKQNDDLDVQNELPSIDNFDSPLLVHLYRDATTTVRFEKRIVESSKMAELGTIGSSIAHQLNNPIGGMLSHIQLLLMDLRDLEFEGKDELYKELKEMESGTRRCAEIVRDLLGFSRRADESAASEHDLLEIIEQAIKITELQTRSRGIRFRIESDASKDGPLHGEAFLVKARFNLLAQAIRAVLLVLSVKRDRQIILKLERAPSGEIKILIEGPLPAGGEHASDKGKLDLTVAEQILTEHGGRLELRKNDQVQLAILSLPPSVQTH